ncbi:hypothetical protein GCM10027347_41080 [Larkinella harenae]
MFTNKLPWVVVLALWTGGSTYWHVCRIKQLCPDGDTPSASVSTPTTPAFTVPGLQFTDGSSASFRSSGHLAFAKSGADVNLNGVRPLLDSLSIYLKSNPEKRIQLTGFYDPTETNSSTEPNLGLARANSIRAYLISLGIPEEQLQLAGEENAQLDFTPAGDSLYGGIRFAFLNEVLVKVEQSTAEEDLAKKAKFESIFEPLDLYFSTGKIDYIKTSETQTFLEKTRAYLQEHPEQKLLITGHTDNTGSDAINLALSKERAAAVKKQFVTAGIAASQIETDGKGESQPLASNDTEKGRRTNRRTSIVVKK